MNTTAAAKYLILYDKSEPNAAKLIRYDAIVGVYIDPEQLLISTVDGKGFQVDSDNENFAKLVEMFLRAGYNPGDPTNHEIADQVLAAIRTRQH